MIASTIAAIAAAATASALGYQSMSPTGQWYGRTFTGSPQRTKQLAFTYDDGPNDPCTLRLLDVLTKHNASATFFLIGRFVRMRPDIVREIVQAGHAIGNHTYTHPLLIFESEPQVRIQLEECQKAIADAAGMLPRFFRPPFGGRRPAVLRVARELGLSPVMWNVTGYDWNAKSSDAIVSNVSRRISGGDVVLLHDGDHLGMGGDRLNTVEATEKLLVALKPAEYEFVALPEMINADAMANASLDK